MAEFTYNNTINTSIDCIQFELNYEYHPRVLFEDKTNPHLRSCSANELAKELRELMEICCENLLHT